MKEIVDALVAVKSSRDASAFLRALWSPQEVLAIKHRLRAIQMLRSGVSHRQVRDRLGIGIATVTRAARVLREHPQIIDKVLGPKPDEIE
jgi:TrpR family trp operon transcriptional repressor